jgi:hypothetical protein
VSFSITNDSLVEPKRVHLRVEGLLGEQREARIDADAFSVRPMRKSIAPMDFEKFVLDRDAPGGRAAGRLPRLGDRRLDRRDEHPRPARGGSCLRCRTASTT